MNVATRITTVVVLLAHLTLGCCSSHAGACDASDCTPRIAASGIAEQHGGHGHDHRSDACAHGDHGGQHSAPADRHAQCDDANCSLLAPKPAPELNPLDRIAPSLAPPTIVHGSAFAHAVDGLTEAVPLHFDAHSALRCHLRKQVLLV